MRRLRKKHDDICYAWHFCSGQWVNWWISFFSFLLNSPRPSQLRQFGQWRWRWKRPLSSKLNMQHLSSFDHFSQYMLNAFFDPAKLNAAGEYSWDGRRLWKTETAAPRQHFETQFGSLADFWEKLAKKEAHIKTSQHIKRGNRRSLRVSEGRELPAVRFASSQRKAWWNLGSWPGSPWPNGESGGACGEWQGDHWLLKGSSKHFAGYEYLSTIYIYICIYFSISEHKSIIAV